MKLLVFAHKPPPHHGQSYMVQLMLEGLGGDCRKAGRQARERPAPAFGIECYHVDARVSRSLEDIGYFQISKFLLLLLYCLQAIWCRLRYGVRVLYYIPAPGKSSALYRDWLVMFLCRPFFDRLILHWHAAGLAKWLETSRQIRTRSFTYRLMKKPDLSVVLSRFNRADAEKLFSRRVAVVSNGIADPCPEFERSPLPQRRARFEARKRLWTGQPVPPDSVDRTGGSPSEVRVLYLAHCTKEKGLFDAVEGVLRANRLLAGRKLRFSLRLWVAGLFVNEEERARFDTLVRQPSAVGQVEYLGFVSGTQKAQLLRDADLFCFPTYYGNENQPVNLIEAMAFGLPILTTRWRSIPELFPRGYEGLVDTRAPDQVAQGLLTLLTSRSGESFRQIFLQNYTIDRHLASLAAAFHSVEQPDSVTAGAPDGVAE